MTDLRIVSRPDVREELARMRTKDLNFEPDRDGPFTPQNGWRIDHYRRQLPLEAPGAPTSGGSWEVATELSEAYEFVDPILVCAFYDPNEPLEGRTLLLRVHFWGLRIYAGVRVAAVSDEVRQIEGRQARVSSWNYRTLENHFEAGQIDYELWKWLDSGEVEFRIDAFSRPEWIPQPIVRWGFRLFGRGRQTRFARDACDRMEALTRARLQGAPAVPPARLIADDLAVSPQGCTETKVERLARNVRSHVPSARG